jgi:hypothetical protein
VKKSAGAELPPVAAAIPLLEVPSDAEVAVVQENPAPPEGSVPEMEIVKVNVEYPESNSVTLMLLMDAWQPYFGDSASDEAGARLFSPAVTVPEEIRAKIPIMKIESDFIEVPPEPKFLTPNPCDRAGYR